MPNQRIDKASAYMRSIVITLALLLSATALAAPDGASLYRHHCAACHGHNGNGGVGVPLTLPDFQNSVSDSFLINTIRYGRPGRVMPSFTALSDEAIAAIVKHLRSWNGRQTPLPVAQPRAGDAVHGKVLYQQYCASCHGVQGEGGHGTGVTFSRPRDLPIIAPALNNSGFLLSASDAMIKSALVYGRRGTPMESFIKQGLSEQDIDDIVSYVRSFAQNPYDQQESLDNIDHTIIRMDSSYDVQTTVENVKRAAIGKNFRIIRVQKLEQGLATAGQEDSRQVIVYFCNFQMLNDALAIDPRVGLFLPCRITVTERNGHVEVMAINPKYLSRIFNNYELNKLCDAMDKTYLEIIEEATL